MVPLLILVAMARAYICNSSSSTSSSSESIGMGEGHDTQQGLMVHTSLPCRWARLHNNYKLSTKPEMGAV
jgi:hypothetical protein